ncbi:hypothetical protein fugu_012589 [Takifugu bimaculatus]|uniref:Uncharacterized protein n=1 Tax=Takifugu bimaculatus TaxID=433685 RepID=A0A4Z2C5T2_9TELE|nr:hypothetical protein fugu_012589 [Takifugu bimaculatus]
MAEATERRRRRRRQRACAVHPGARRRSVLKWGGWQKNSGHGHYTARFPFTMSLRTDRVSPAPPLSPEDTDSPAHRDAVL